MTDPDELGRGDCGRSPQDAGDARHRDLTGPDQSALREALNRYLGARRTQRHAVAGTADRALAAARADLVHLLEQAGWEPPPSVLAALDADAPRVQAPHRRSA